MNILEIKNLIKDYGSLRAVDDISFIVKKGELFAFLGENGAGKSTTINIICTSLKKTSGEVFVCGHKLSEKDDEIRKCIGAVFQIGVLDEVLTVRENIMTRAAFYGIEKNEAEKRLEELAKAIDIDFLDRRYGKLSGGQKRKSDIARALINNPQILFLDEPTTGLDPATRIKVWEVLEKLKNERGMTLFLTTHYMEEAEKADSVCIIHKGKIAAGGTPNQLKEKYSFDTLKIVPADKDAVEAYLNKVKLNFSFKTDQFIIKVKDSLQGLEVLEHIKSKIGSFEVIKGNMDSVFLTVTGEKTIDN